MRKNRSFLYFFMLMIWWFIGQTAIAQAPTLIAQVDQGIVPQTQIHRGWLPVRIVFAYQGTTYTARLQINPESYNRYTHQMARHPRPSNLVARLQLAQNGTKEIVPLISALRRAAPNQQSEKLAGFALAFVQSLPYEYDALTTPYDEAWRAPLQTLVDQEIDCEDSSILYSSLLSGLGINNGLVLVPGHMLTAVEGHFTGKYLRRNGKKYYIAETTGLQWTIGELPPPHKVNDADFLPVSAMQQPSPTASIHNLAENNSTESSSPSSHFWMIVLLVVMIGALLLWWFNNNQPLNNNNFREDFNDFDDDDPYKDYD